MVTKQSATSAGLSAGPEQDNLPAQLDHSSLVKYNSRGNPTYRLVRQRIQDLVSEALQWRMDREYIACPPTHLTC